MHISQVKCIRRGVVPGGAGGAMALADQLTLSQPKGADYAHQIILALPDFQTFPRPCKVLTLQHDGKSKCRSQFNF